MFTSKERVERDGFLIAYAGETMSDAEAARRGLTNCCAGGDDADVLNVGTSADNGHVAVVNPPIDEAWADAAGMSVEDCIELWNEDPNAVLEAIKSNLAAKSADDDASGNAGDNAEDTDNAASGTEGNSNAESPNGADNNAGDAGAKPSREELRKECEARGIKAPKNATIAQLEALLEE